MKAHTLVSLFVLVTACGTDGKDGKDGAPGAVGQSGKDGINGKDGTNGTNGKDGINGKDGAPASKEMLDVASALQDASKNVVDVECLSNGYRGTGVKLLDGEVLTAEHVVRGCTFVAFYSNGTLVGTGGTGKQGGTRDILYVSGVAWNEQGNALTGVQLKSTPNKVKVGESIFVLSHPIDLVIDVQMTHGLVTDASFQGAPDMWVGSFISDAASASGSSGAPVFNSKAELIGIHVGGWSAGGLELGVELYLIEE